jgi:hypothetical protein
MINVSILDVPLLLETTSHSTSTLVSNWVALYNRGARTYPVLSGGTCLVYLITALRSDASSRERLLLPMAAVINLAMVPFTWTVMKRSIDNMFRLREFSAAGKLEAAETEANVRMAFTHWGWLNAARALFPLAGAIWGLYAVSR